MGAGPGRCWRVGWLVGSWSLGQWPVSEFPAFTLEGERDTGATRTPEPSGEKLRSGIQVSVLSWCRLTAILATESPRFKRTHGWFGGSWAFRPLNIFKTWGHIYLTGRLNVVTPVGFACVPHPTLLRMCHQPRASLQVQGWSRDTGVFRAIMSQRGAP